MFARSRHDDGIVLDVGFPIYRRHQIEELIEVSGHGICQFEIELIAYPAPEIHLRDRRKIALEADYRRS